MVFSSILFLFVYLPVVLAVYYVVPARYRNLWLFIVNLVFYGWGEPVYILLMAFSIVLNYTAGLLIARYRLLEDKKARAVLTVNTVVNLALLVFFKYFDLLAATLSRIPGISIPALGLTLPIGISFYTFQTMSYPIDVYRGDTEEQKNFIRFGTFVALFPQLIAGPIVRYKDVASQLGARRLNAEKFSSGVQRFTVGLGKKVLIANNIGALWDVYAAAPELSFAGAWLGAIAFSLQLYFDFSGYSDMAIGLGRMLGFEFPENFNYPYISKSVTEFWRRWHISLGTWFRDYLYIPLGGNRRGLSRQILNILIVWALTGLWHGASWNFVLWGLYYFVLLMLDRLFWQKLLDKLPKAVSAVLSHITLPLAVLFGWVLFKFTSLPLAAAVVRGMFCGNGNAFTSFTATAEIKSHMYLLIFCAAAATPVFSHFAKRWERAGEESVLARKSYSVAACGIAPVLLLLISTACLVGNSFNPFLYFRF